VGRCQFPTESSTGFITGFLLARDLVQEWFGHANVRLTKWAVWIPENQRILQQKINRVSRKKNSEISKNMLKK